MTKNLGGNPYYTVPSLGDPNKLILFEAQPIMALQGSRVVGHELLYRGAHPAVWPKVDAALVKFLGVARDMPLVFVNLSNQGLLEVPLVDLEQASFANRVIFELSESVSEYEEREAIAKKVNQLIDAGVRVAVDDFGTGRDSLERIYELKPTAAVKVDRRFLQTCASRGDAASTLGHLIKQWREAGIWSIAEGVETDELLSFAQSVGVDMVQGWHVDTLINAPRAA